ncbi:Hypothetical predicted protein [Mytilus galloprovincialis]|uniref:Uncharacterized protein n=1 Tax=Mytilus galloprovincialis TaxID=29158 RepID=A0A8B6DFZ1_MYTGA|nr:Hypothetical predicted protein [Mytilus galloprovincialis]
MNIFPTLLTIIIFVECQMVCTNEVPDIRQMSDLNETEDHEIEEINSIERRFISEDTYSTEVTSRIEERSEDNEKAGERIDRQVKRATITELEHQLNVARKENRAQIKACGEEHKFKPFEQCKNCYQNCGGPRHCMRCRLVCLQDKNELNSKGCDIDKSKINKLRERINVLKSGK